MIYLLLSERTTKTIDETPRIIVFKRMLNKLWPIIIDIIKYENNETENPMGMPIPKIVNASESIGDMNILIIVPKAICETIESSQIIFLKK